MDPKNRRSSPRNDTRRRGRPSVNDESARRPWPPRTPSTTRADVAQLVEQLTRNEQVVRSNRIVGSILVPRFRTFATRCREKRADAATPLVPRGAVWCRDRVRETRTFRRHEMSIHVQKHLRRRPTTRLLYPQEVRSPSDVQTRKSVSPASCFFPASRKSLLHQ